MKLLSIASITAILTLSSCATIVSKSDYPVTIQSNPSNLQFKVFNKNGQEVAIGRTPNTIILSAGGGFSASTYTIKTYKNGKVSGINVLKGSFDGWYAGNLLFGGIIGLILDPATGNAYKLPSNFTVESAGSIASNFKNAKKGDLVILAKNDLPKEIQDQLIAL